MLHRCPFLLWLVVCASAWYLRPSDLSAAVVIADSFTAAIEGADLVTYTTPAGDGYIRHPSASGTILCGGGRIRAGGPTIAHYLHTYATLPAEFDATVGFLTVGGNDTDIGFVFRCSDAALLSGRTYYEVRHDARGWRPMAFS